MTNGPKRFIECLLPVTACNLQCEYCYVIQEQRRKNEIPGLNYPIDHMISALSQKRLGGVCYFSICGAGETLIPHYVVDIIKGLLQEGHFVNVTTNGTFDNRFKEIVTLDKDLLARLHFSFSFHYLELKRTNKIDAFFDNINLVKQHGCSYVLQINLYDGYLPYISEINNLCIKRCGAKPQVAATRDELNNSYKLLTKLSLDDYKEYGKKFDSPLFDFTMKNFNIKRKEFCYAGDWSFLLNLKTGIMTKCYRNTEGCFNVFESPNDPIPFEAIGKNCKHDYCVNSSHFLSLGVIPSLITPSYASLRNRKNAGWYTDKMESFLSQKLINNNVEYSKIEKKRISRLYRPSLKTKSKRMIKYILFLLKRMMKNIIFFCKYLPNRKKIAFFVSQPYHTNIGDSAIALAEIEIAKKYFSHVVEIDYDSFYKYRVQINRFLNKKNKIILLQGGGNFGDLWINEERHRRRVIETIHNSKIIIFPQSIVFENPLNEIESKPYYNKENITILTREKYSFNVGKSLYPLANVVLIPDIVLFSKMFEELKSETQRKGILLMFRQDKEKQLSLNDTNLIKEIIKKQDISFEEIENHHSSPIMPYARKQIVFEAAKKISKSKLLITDRLHGMIFALLTNTPCLLFENNNKKVLGTYELIKDHSCVKLVNSINELPNAVFEMLKLDGICDNNVNVDNYNDSLINVLKNYANN